jgi:hypothetical protein
MKKRIITEEIEFYYSNEFNENFQDNKFLISTNAAQFIEVEKLKSVCRISLTKDLKREKIWVDYLFWFDETNLEELDQNVLNDSFTDENFENSIKTYFVEKLICFNCKTVHFGSLAIDRGSSYFGKLGLTQQKLTRLLSTNKIKVCPNCSNKFTMPVVHIF